MNHYMLAVVGRNISYSKSPLIHHAFAEPFQLDLRYTIQDVGNGCFADKITELQALGFQGCNITVPFKEEAFQLADTASARAKQAGAANTFLFKSGKIYADNTDGVGFIRDVTLNLGFNFTGKSILICGAGGAVRGILAPLMAQAPRQVIIANRTPEKSQELAKHFSTDHCQIQAVTYPQLEHHAFDLIIDGTSLKQECVPLPKTVQLSAESVVYDLKYNLEEKTPIQQWGLAHGALQVADGIGMLVEQAAEAFHLWTGKTPNTQQVIHQLTVANKA